jgi:hypothetical protein
MTQVTLLPDAVFSNTGSDVGGSSPSLLYDSNDSSYVDLVDGDAIIVTLGNLTLPPNAQVRFVLGICRVSRPLFNAGVLMDLGVGSLHAGWGTTVTWGDLGLSVINTLFGPAMGQGTAQVVELDQVDVNGMVATFACTGPGNAYLHEMSMVCQYWEQPVVTTLDTVPSGTSTEDDTPSVIWGRDWDSDSTQPIKYYRVVVLTDLEATGGGSTPIADPDDADTVEHDSGIVDGDPVTPGSFVASYDELESLDNGDYYVYVRVADEPQPDEPNWSEWVSQPFTINVPRPAEPTLDLTPQDSVGRVRWVATIDPDAGDVEADYVEVQRRSAGEDTFSPMRTRSDNPPGRATISSANEASGNDYEAMNGIMDFIRVRTVHDYGEGTLGRSDWVQASAQWSSLDTWLKHPYNPQLNRVVRLRSAPERTQAARQGVFQPLGRRDPVLVSDSRGLWTGTLTFRSDTQEDRYYIEQLFLMGVPLLLQAPAAVYMDDMWIVGGDLTQARVVDNDMFPWTFDSVTFMQVLRPDGVLVDADPPAPPDEPGEDLVLI